MRTPVAEESLPRPDLVRDKAFHAAREAKPWVAPLDRFGHVAIGIVYASVGLLAAQTALGRGGAVTDSEGALQWLVQRPFGGFVLGAMALGLAGYAIWRFVQAALDTEGKGTNLEGLVERGAYVVIGFTYAGLAISAFQLSLGAGHAASGDASARDWTARLLARPLGQWLVGVIGAIVVGVGLFQFHMANSRRFRDCLRLSEMSPTQVAWVTRLGTFGYAARGVVFVIIGAALVVAAGQSQPEQARGLGGALATLAEQPYGPLLLAVVAAGLIAYGAFMLASARFRRMVI